MCNIHVFYWLRELYNPGSMEAGEYGLPRGTCFIARGLEVVAVAGLLWISWCVLGASRFRFFFPVFFIFERTRPAASMGSPCLFTSLLVSPKHFLLTGASSTSVQGAYVVFAGKASHSQHYNHTPELSRSPGLASL